MTARMAENPSVDLMETQRSIGPSLVEDRRDVSVSFGFPRTGAREKIGPWVRL